MTDFYNSGIHAVLVASGLVKSAARKETKILRSLLGGTGRQKAPAPKVVGRSQKDTRWDPAINPVPDRTVVPHVKGPAKTPHKPDDDFVHRYQIQAGSDPTKANAFLGKMHQRGYQPREYVGHLGGGGEGAADLVARRGRLEARKTYNPDAHLYSPEGIKRKEEIMRSSQARLGKDENPLTEFYESKTVRSPATGKDYTQHYTEYVPHTQTGQPWMDYSGLKNSLNQAHPQYRATDYADTWQRSSHGNNIAVTPSGRQRVVDFIPAKPSEGVISGTDAYGRRGIQISPGGNYFPNHRNRVEEGLPLSPFANVQKNPDAMQAYMRRGATLNAKNTPTRQTVADSEYNKTIANSEYYKAAPTSSGVASAQASGPPPARHTPPPRNYNHSGPATPVVGAPASRQRAT